MCELQSSYNTVQPINNEVGISIDKCCKVKLGIYEQNCGERNYLLNYMSFI